MTIAVELLPGIEAKPEMPGAIAESVKAQLLRLNSEFAHYVPSERQLPKVSLHPFADVEYFQAGVKHRYSRP